MTVPRVALLDRGKLGGLFSDILGANFRVMSAHLSEASHTAIAFELWVGRFPIREAAMRLA